MRSSVLIYTNCDFYLCGGGCVGVVQYDAIFFFVPCNSVSEMMHFLAGCADGV